MRKSSWRCNHAEAWNTPSAIYRLFSGPDAKGSLLQRFDKEVSARVLAGMPAIHLKNIRITTTTFKWVAETLCEKGDPRLTRTTTNIDATWSNGSAESSATNLPANIDPCRSLD